MARTDLLGGHLIGLGQSRGAEGFTKREAVETVGDYIAYLRENGYLRADSPAWKNISADPANQARRGIENALLRLTKNGELVRRIVYRLTRREAYTTSYERGGRTVTSTVPASDQWISEYVYYAIVDAEGRAITPRDPFPGEQFGPIERIG